MLELVSSMNVYEIRTRLSSEAVAEVDDSVVLDHLQREKGRLKVSSAGGDELRLFLERGRVLQVGEVLQSDCGRNFRVTAAVEPVVRAHTDDWVLFSRACYHLGNRHVKMQVGERWLRISPDHVLREMLELLGLATEEEQASFEPEPGAYSGGHSHGHSDDHSHAHSHSHEHH